MAKPEGQKKVEVFINVENEMLILAAMMNDAIILRDLSTSISSELFLGERHRSIFLILQDVATRSLKFDIEVFDQLSFGRGYGGRDYILGLCKGFPSKPKNIDFHTDKLRVDSIKGKLRTGLVQQLVDATEDPATDLDRLGGIVRGVNTELAANLTGGVTVGKQLYERYNANLRARRQSRMFTSTGFSWMDESLTEGLARKRISVWTARPSMGKSTFAWNMADRVAHRTKVKTLYLALEMDQIGILDGIISSRTNIPINDIVKETPSLSAAKLSLLNKTAYDLTGQGMLAFWDKGLDIEKLYRIISEGGYGLCVFDLYEKMIRTKTQDVIASHLDQMQQIAKDTNAHFALFHQTRRGVERRPNKRPTLEDLKNSGGYEEVADLVCYLYRNKYYFPDEEENIIEVGGLKQRRGPQYFQTFYEFDGAFGKVGKERRDWKPYSAEME